MRRFSANSFIIITKKGEINQVVATIYIRILIDIGGFFGERFTVFVKKDFNQI